MKLINERIIQKDIQDIFAEVNRKKERKTYHVSEFLQHSANIDEQLDKICRVMKKHSQQVTTTQVESKVLRKKKEA